MVVVTKTTHTKAKSNPIKSINFFFSEIPSISVLAFILFDSFLNFSKLYFVVFSFVLSVDFKYIFQHLNKKRIKNKLK